MKRTQVQLEEDTYQLLRHKAFQRGISMSALLREMLREHLEAEPKQKRKSLADFGFIAAGQSKQGEYSPVSERHDEALAEEFAR